MTRARWRKVRYGWIKKAGGFSVIIWSTLTWGAYFGADWPKSLGIVFSIPGWPEADLATAKRKAEACVRDRIRQASDAWAVHE